jgi:hypothetical protein
LAAATGSTLAALRTLPGVYQQPGFNLGDQVKEAAERKAGALKGNAIFQALQAEHRLPVAATLSVSV